MVIIFTCIVKLHQNKKKLCSKSRIFEYISQLIHIYKVIIPLFHLMIMFVEGVNTHTIFTKMFDFSHEEHRGCIREWVSLEFLEIK